MIRYPTADPGGGGEYRRGEAAGAVQTPAAPANTRRVTPSGEVSSAYLTGAAGWGTGDGPAPVQEHSGTGAGAGGLCGWMEGGGPYLGSRRGRPGCLHYSPA